MLLQMRLTGQLPPPLPIWGGAATDANSVTLRFIGILFFPIKEKGEGRLPFEGVENRPFPFLAGVAVTGWTVRAPISSETRVGTPRGKTREFVRENPVRAMGGIPRHACVPTVQPAQADEVLLRRSLGERWNAPRMGTTALGSRTAVSEGLLAGLRQRHDGIGAEADIDGLDVDPQPLAPGLRQASRGGRFSEQRQAETAPAIAVPSGPLRGLHEDGSELLGTFHRLPFSEGE